MPTSYVTDNRKARATRQRKGLQVLHPNVDSPDVLVPNLGRIGKQSREPLKPAKILTSDHDKENTEVPRRSKRKNPATLSDASSKTVKEPSVTPPVKPSKAKSTKSKAAAKKAKTKTADKNQSFLEEFFDSKPKKDTVGDLIHGDNRPSEEINDSFIKLEDDVASGSVRVFRSLNNETVLMTPSVKKSAEYWEELAELRRVALENTLYENAQLQDQLEVLETENSQLKSSLHECEKLIEDIKVASKNW